MLGTVLAVVAAVLLVVGLLDLVAVIAVGNGVTLIVLGLIVAVVAYLVAYRGRGRSVL